MLAKPQTGVPAKPEQRKLELIKHSGAISVQNSISLLQRRAWNVLLWNAYYELGHEEVHRISIRDLAHHTGYDSHDIKHLKDSARAMMHYILEWDILGKDGAVGWVGTALLASARIEAGMFVYSYSPELRHLLHNPRMYARLDLELQKQFDSKYALALWELCTDYLGSGREHGETPPIPLDVFRKIMGAVEGKYALFRDLNKYVLKPALAAVNRLSDFRVSVELQYQGRKVTAMKFKIHRVKLLPASMSSQSELFPDLEEMPAAVKLLQDAGLALQDAKEVWEEGFGGVEEDRRPVLNGEHLEEAFTRYVREKIHLLEQRKKQGKADSPTGFLLIAIRKNFSNAQFEAEEMAQVHRKHAKELKALREKIDQIKRDEDTALNALSTRIVEMFPSQLDQAVAALLAEHSPYVQSYDDTQTPRENYEKHLFVMLGVSQWFEQKFPEEFAQARAKFQEERVNIEAHIKLLEAEGVKVYA